MSIEAMKQARQIIWRYRHETPLGNQPHMIAHEADETLNRIDQAIARAEHLEAAVAEQHKKQSDIPKIGCVNHDCDKCKAEKQEPVAWRLKHQDSEYGITCYDKEQADSYIQNGWELVQQLCTSPPTQCHHCSQRPATELRQWVEPLTWRGLTDEDVMSIAFNFDVSSLSLVAKAVEAKLREKNSL